MAHGARARLSQRGRDGAWQVPRRRSSEKNVVSKFVEELVRTYGYPKTHIATDPQHRVKLRPSDKGGYPVDIAVFGSAKRGDSELKIIVECKAPNVKSGKSQLRSYLGMSHAEIGV